MTMHGHEAERAVLGAALLSPRAATEVTDLLTTTDLALPEHRAIFTAISALIETGQPVDVLSVTDELTRASAWNAALTPALLHELAGETPTAANAAHYAGIVREDATRRALIAAADRITAAADPTVPLADALEDARAAVDEITDRGRTIIPALADDVQEWLASLDTPARLVPSPWLDLDRITGGWTAGGMHVIAARPGGGKSIVGIQAAKHAAETGPVLIISLEMSRHDVYARLHALTAGVNVGRIIRHNLNPDERRAVTNAAASLERRGTLHVATANEVTTVADALAAMRRVKREAGGLELVVVDYLQLLTTGARAENRQVEVAAISRALKLAAGQLDVPILALSQLRRREGDVPPQIQDLRESGALEQDADVVMLMHRSEDDDSILHVDVAKARNGHPGMLTLAWEGEFSRVHTRFAPTSGGWWQQ